jgi:hypothetical protein
LIRASHLDRFAGGDGRIKSGHDEIRIYSYKVAEVSAYKRIPESIGPSPERRGKVKKAVKTA